MSVSAALLPLLALVSQAPAPAPGSIRPPTCADLSLPALPACRLTGQGVVFAGTAQEADAAAAAANQGEESYRRHVGPVTRYAVVVGENVGEPIRLLNRAGYPIVLPWLNPAARQRGRDESIRRATEAQLQGSGLSRERIEAAVLQAQAQARGPQDGRLLVSYAAIAHELGHLWLIQGFWRGRVPAADGPNAGHYGGPGPDWLDEAVAIAMEEDSLTAPRRTRFRELVRGEAPGGVATLAAFFAMDHPLKGLGALVRSGAFGTAGTGATVLTGDEAIRRLGVRPEAGPNFYAQARVVADFLIERSGNARVLGEIAQAVSRGERMDAWLAGRGRANRLGTTMAELEALWAAWIRARYGA